MTLFEGEGSLASTTRSVPLGVKRPALQYRRATPKQEPQWPSTRETQSDKPPSRCPNPQPLPFLFSTAVGPAVETVGLQRLLLPLGVVAVKDVLPS